MVTSFQYSSHYVRTTIKFEDWCLPWWSCHHVLPLSCLPIARTWSRNWANADTNGKAISSTWTPKQLAEWFGILLILNNTVLSHNHGRRSTQKLLHNSIRTYVCYPFTNFRSREPNSFFSFNSPKHLHNTSITTLLLDLPWNALYFVILGACQWDRQLCSWSKSD